MSLTHARGRLLAALLLLALSIPLALPTSHGQQAQVIVRGASLQAAVDAVTAVGGTVQGALPIIGGVHASVPARAVSALASVPEVRSVSPDGPVQLLQDDDDATDEPNSMRSIIQATRAHKMWNAGFTGQGVGIALIDSGVVPVSGLDGPNVVHGPDLSFESQIPEARHLDTFGHGTHLASIIAGSTTEIDPQAPFRSTDGHFMGMAPDATLISLKVADAQGQTDISQIIAAIDWVVQHRGDHNIRVLNLSFGVYSHQDYTIDPLAHAAQVAWDAGIVVVVAAGNQGDSRPGLTSPAYHPGLLAVGALDTNNTHTRGDWEPLSFSAVAGPDGRAPDLLATGSSVVGLRAPGSYLDQQHGDQARVGSDGFRGSGTSQAAAVVSGGVALLLQKHPEWSPDQVKRALIDNAMHFNPRRGFTAQTGNKALHLKDFARGSAEINTPSPGPRGTGGGLLEAARGGHNLVVDGVALEGEIDIFGQPLDTQAMAESQSLGTSWNGGLWNGNQWSGNQWSGNQWSSVVWEADAWYGSQWSGNQWSGNQWSGVAWNGSQWSGSQWSGSQWSGSQWSNARWG